MKKLYTENKFKKYNQYRAEDRLYRRLRYQQWAKSKRRAQQGKSKEKIKEENKFKDFVKVKTPLKFSFIKNPEETIKVINKLEELLKLRKKVYIDIKDIEELDYSAITVLVSIMFIFKEKNVDFGGNYPKNKKLRQQLIDSEFFKYFDRPIKNKIEYTIGKPNQIFTRANKKVNPELGKVVMHEASKTIWDEARTCKGLQRVLLELMQNTNNHASLSGKGVEYWWLSVNHNKCERKVSFTFVDYGIGIFESLKHKPRDNKWFGWLEKIKDRLRYGKNFEVLKLLLDGDLHMTVTGQHFRGKGLPGIKEVLNRNQISKLFIISNDVFADVDNNHYKALNTNFHGTFLSWELNKNSESLKWIE